jgi:uncharacterized integral membrane protein
MQMLSRILLILVLITAALFGAFNGRMVELDFVFAKLNLPLGVALLIFLVIGALVGAAVSYLAFVPKIRAENKRRAEAQKQA